MLPLLPLTILLEIEELYPLGDVPVSIEFCFRAAGETFADRMNLDFSIVWEVILESSKGTSDWFSPTVTTGGFSLDSMVSPKPLTR